MPLPQTTHCTYADYLTWDTEQKYELFDGVPVMQRVRSIQHQSIEGAFAPAAAQLPLMASRAAPLPRSRCFFRIMRTRVQTM